MRDESESKVVCIVLRHDATTCARGGPRYYVSRTGSGKDKMACDH